MPKLPQFNPPANQNDFRSGEEEKEKAFRSRWNSNINRYTEQTLQNDPWDSVNQPTLTQYYNPLNTDIPEGIKGAVIKWTAFPNRILITFPNVGQRTQWQFADEGPSDPNYNPRGPRGWQDEYCEWSVTRNSEGKITKVMFTCENREYWYTLWDIEPAIVLRLYQELVGAQVQLEDLYLRNDNGEPIIDPETGRPAYDDRNKWNSTTTDGAVHLVSNPNALSAEIFLAGQATVLRQNSAGNPITDKNQLINCSQYGTPNRNSDPTIGASVNALVRGTGQPGSGVRISLQNPVGLYIQEPSFDTYQLPLNAPANAQPSDYWKVVRGRRRQNGEDMDFILHAVFEVPEDQGFTVSDIAINGFNIEFGSQITQTFDIALAGLPLPQITPPESFQCAGFAQQPLPRPFLLRDLELVNAAARGNLKMRIEPGTTVENVVLIAFNSDRDATIALTGAPGITATKVDFQDQNGEQIFFLTITAAPNAPLGDRSLLLTNPDGSQGPAVFGLLEVVSPGTLARTTESGTRSASAEKSPVTSIPMVKLPRR
ncbi:hypothetical protein WA1_27160 [Scytonema hofmannii PCC 7110]|uniref:Uncharacterized protein n=1 Tax=Scytonema hofmannii PCC 7110 TaxID=128403 RepID=A0A139X689_9CYAN|nr:hypothetical protein [Scytonema hofmannii]KYC40219.1 hypothetical protein WA1_27160 [Scytonema hofmannii PCC 7110]